MLLFFIARPNHHHHTLDIPLYANAADFPSGLQLEKRRWREYLLEPPWRVLSYILQGCSTINGSPDVISPCPDKALPQRKGGISANAITHPPITITMLVDRQTPER